MGSAGRLEQLRRHQPRGRPDGRRADVGSRAGAHERPALEPRHRSVLEHARPADRAVLRLPDPTTERDPGGGRRDRAQEGQHRSRADAALQLEHQHLGGGPVDAHAALVPDRGRAARRPPARRGRPGQGRPDGQRARALQPDHQHLDRAPRAGREQGARAVPAGDPRPERQDLRHQERGRASRRTSTSTPRPSPPSPRRRRSRRAAAWRCTTPASSSTTASARPTETPT